MNWYVYIARAKTGFYYTGITTVVSKRITAHNRGKGSQMGKQQGPFELMYQSEPFENKSAASRLEAQIKRWSRRKKEMLISREWI